MAASTFNLKDNQKAERKLLVTCVNVGSHSAPSWERVGHGIEESSIEFNPDIETVNDILGITETDVNDLEMTQDFEPYTIRGGSKLAEKLYDIYKRKAYSEFALFEVLIIHGYVGNAGSYEAELQTDCTITPQSLGGDAHVDMPIQIGFSKKSTWGTVNSLTTSIKFTASASIGPQADAVALNDMGPSINDGDDGDDMNTVSPSKPLPEPETEPDTDGSDMGII